MFAAWGRLVYRHRRIVVAASLVITMAMGLFAAGITSVLSSGGWIVKE